MEEDNHFAPLSAKAQQLYDTLDEEDDVFISSWQVVEQDCGCLKTYITYERLFGQYDVAHTLDPCDQHTVLEE